VVLSTANWVATIDTNTGLVSYADTHGNPLTSENVEGLRRHPVHGAGAQQQGRHHVQLACR